jgi:hypothetical protein
MKRAEAKVGPAPAPQDDAGLGHDRDQIGLPFEGVELRTTEGSARHGSRPLVSSG